MGKHVHRWLMGPMLAIACQLGWVWAEAAAPLIRVAQVVAQGTAVTAYLDLRDRDGGVPKAVSAAQVRATLGAHAAIVTELVTAGRNGELGPVHRSSGAGVGAAAEPARRCDRSAPAARG